MNSQLFEEEEHTRKYRLHRPDHPHELYERIINYYYNGNARQGKIPLAVDVGCGTGQAAVALSSFCERVIGIDTSANQIAHAMKKDNIEYRCQAAEDLTFLESNSVDLITAAVALHWLDVKLFVEQVKRVLKQNVGVLAIWTYRMFELDNPVANTVCYELDQVILYSYWNTKRWLNDDYYESLLPLLPYKSTFVEHLIERSMQTTIGQVTDLVDTFSGVQAYRRQEGDVAYRNLLETFQKKLIDAYKSSSSQTTDCNEIPVVMSNPTKLYLMRKSGTD